MTSQCSVWAHPSRCTFHLGLAPLWRPFVERRVHWRSREKSESEKAPGPFRLAGQKDPFPTPHRTVATSPPPPPAGSPPNSPKGAGSRFLYTQSYLSCFITYHHFSLQRSDLEPRRRPLEATLTGRPIRTQ